MNRELIDKYNCTYTYCNKTYYKRLIVNLNLSKCRIYIMNSISFFKKIGSKNIEYNLIEQ